MLPACRPDGAHPPAPMSQASSSSAAAALTGTPATASPARTSTSAQSTTAAATQRPLASTRPAVSAAPRVRSGPAGRASLGASPPPSAPSRTEAATRWLRARALPPPAPPIAVAHPHDVSAPGCLICIPQVGADSPARHACAGTTPSLARRCAGAVRRACPAREAPAATRQTPAPRPTTAGNRACPAWRARQRRASRTSPARCGGGVGCSGLAVGEKRVRRRRPV